MSDLLSGARDVLEFLFSGTVSTVLGVTLGIATIAGFVYPRVRRRLRRALLPWRLERLDSVAKSFHDDEQAYLTQFLDLVDKEDWDPTHYVKPGLRVRQRKLEPVRPVLLLLETSAMDRLTPEMDLQDRRETLATHRTRDLLPEVRRLKQFFADQVGLEVVLDLDTY